MRRPDGALLFVLGVQVRQHGRGHVEVLLAVGDGATGSGNQNHLVALGFAVGFHFLVHAFEHFLGQLGFFLLGLGLELLLLLAYLLLLLLSLT